MDSSVCDLRLDNLTPSKLTRVRPDFSDEYSSPGQMRWDWDHLLSFSPLPALKNVTCPVPGMFGELDSSTDASDAVSNMRKVLAAAGHADLTAKIFPNAGHSLGEMPASNRMAPGVFATLRSWLLDRVRVAEPVVHEE